MAEQSRRQRPAKAVRRDAAEGERRLWTRLRRKQIDDAKFRRHFPIHDVIATFACVARKTVVEFDVSSIALPQELSHEQRRLDRMVALGWKIIFVTHEDVFLRIDDVVAQITKSLPPINKAEVVSTTASPEISAKPDVPADTGWRP